MTKHNMACARVSSDQPCDCGAEPKQEVYEYAGFQYVIEHRDGGDVVLTPVLGQHLAAYRDRHIRNAKQMYLEGQT